MAKRKQSKNRKAQAIWWVLFVLYAGVMLWLLLWRSQNWIDGLSYQQMLLENFNIKPFYTIDNYINIIVNYPDSYYFRHCIINLFGNVLLFIPAGFLIPRVFKTMRKFFPFLLTCILSILFIELVQLFALLGSFDIDDIILNLSGILIGYILFACVFKE